MMPISPGLNTISTPKSGHRATPVRKSRAPKSCYPCYKRKVKCDRKSPCSLCVKRGYAHLCTFVHPSRDEKTSQSPTDRISESSQNQGCCENGVQTNTRQVTIMRDSQTVSVDTQEWRTINDRLVELSHSIASLRSQLETSSSTPTTSPSSSEDDHSPKTVSNNEEITGGVRMRNAFGGSPIHCGSDSVLAFLLEKPQRSIFKEENVLSQLGLENSSATYPFLDLWSSDISSYSNGSVCAALPEDRICRGLLRSYRDVRMTLYPVIADFDRFEQDVQALLKNRALEGLSTSHAMASIEQFGFSIAFVGILFAVLASGCQVSEFSKNKMASSRQTYVSCAYQCLRNSNFLSRPTMEAVQTLLILGDVLSYDMNPGIAYTTFGVAQRMALTLGLHAESAVFKDPGAYRRQQLWWSMAWQDSHFGLSYDRPVETLSAYPQIPRLQGSRPGMRGYFETMCSVISLILQLLRDEVLLGSDITDRTIPTYKIELNKILADAEPYLQSEDHCFTLKDHIERLALKLRSSYLVSEICRRSLKQPSSTGDKTPRLCNECIESLVDTIEAYIELHAIIPHGSRSWIHLHSAISSAFLLSVDETAQSKPSTWSILERLEKVLCDLTTSAESADHQAQSPTSKNSMSPDPVLDLSIGDYFSSAPRETSDFSSSLGQTFMLSNFPLCPESPTTISPKLDNTSNGAVDFLSGTLSSLRKIIAGFETRRAKIGDVETSEKTPSCCASRCSR